MSDTDIKKRLYVGGLPQSVTEDDVKKRFELFLAVSSVSLKSQTDFEGNHIKTFAHLSVEGTEAGLKKCYNAYQNAKWKGSIIKIEDAKENFLDRLEVERQELGNAKSKRKKVEEWKPPEIDKLNAALVPGTPIPGKKDWVVGKYGRVLPVLNVKKSHVTKAIKHDPSKFCHASKVFKDDGKDDTKISKVNNDALTWEIDEPDSEMTKKRKGDFPSDPKPKKSKPFPAELLATSVDEYFSKRFPNKENSSKKSSGNDGKVSKKSSSGKENISNSGQETVNGVHDDDDFDEDDNDDGMEIVKMGSNEENKDKPRVRSRFDSDYESDGGEGDTINTKTKSPPAKAKTLKKKDSKINLTSVSNKQKSSPKKAPNKVSSSEEDDCEDETEIAEFKGIGSLITKSSQKKETPKKKASSSNKEKPVCNGNSNMDSEEEVKDEKNGAKSIGKKKRKLEKKTIPEQPSAKKAKLSNVVQETSSKLDHLPAAQKEMSQYTDLYLSEFVAKAPKNTNQSRPKYDPYDSDLDSDNFELVARKLAKRAGVKTTQENDRKSKEDDEHLKALVEDCSKTNVERGIASLMREIAGGYSTSSASSAAIAKNSEKSSSKDKKPENSGKSNNGSVSTLKEKSKPIPKVTPPKDKKPPATKISSKDINNASTTKPTLSKNKKDTLVSKSLSNDSDVDGDESEDDEDHASAVKKKVPVTKTALSKDKKDNSLSKTPFSDSDEDSEDEEDDASDVKEKTHATKPTVSKNTKDTSKSKTSSSDSDDDDSDEESEDDEDTIDVKKKTAVAKPTFSKDKKDTPSSKTSSSGSDEDNSDDSEDASSVEKKLPATQPTLSKNKKVTPLSKTSSSDDEEEESEDDEDSSDEVKKAPATKPTLPKNIKDESLSKTSSNDSSDGSDDDDDEDSEEECSSEDDEDATDVKKKLPATKGTLSKSKKDASSDSDDDSEEARDVKKKLPATKAALSKDKKTAAGPSRAVFNGSDDDDDDEAMKSDHEDQEISLAEEKKRNLQVLENVVGKTKVDNLTAKLKRNNVQIMDMNQLRFDPTKLKSQQKETKKAKAPAKKPSKQEEGSVKEIQKEATAKAEITAENNKKQKKESEKSKVSAKSEVTMNDSLVNMLKTGAQSGGGSQEKVPSFSLLDMFDGQGNEGNGEEAMEIETQQLPMKPLASLRLPQKLKPKGSGAMYKDMSGQDGEQLDSKPEDSEGRNSKASAKRKESKDKALMKDAVIHKDEAEKSNVKKSKKTLDKLLRDAGKVDVRFSKKEWELRNTQIRLELLKTCKSRNNYAVRKKRAEEENEKHKSVRKFGSWKK